MLVVLEKVKSGFFSAGRPLAELQQDMAKASVVLAVVVVPVRHFGTLERMGLSKVIGANRIFESRQGCLGGLPFGVVKRLAKLTGTEPARTELTPAQGVTLVLSTTSRRVGRASW